MSRPVIVVGDRTSHGGVVITGSPFTDVGGKAVARIGDKVTCPQKGHGSVTTIVTGDLTAIIDGQPVARHGDKTACGATLISSQILTYVDNESAVGYSPSGNSFAQPAAAGDKLKNDALRHEIRFQALDAATGQPVPHNPYVVTRQDGTRTEGVTDGNGLTEIINADQPEDVSVHFYFRSPSGNTIQRGDLA